MSITSLAFWVFLFCAVLIYYVFPIKKYQWVILLLISLSFFSQVSGIKLIIYVLFAAIVTWGGALGIRKSKSEKQKKIWLILTIVLTVGELASLKYVLFGYNVAGLVTGVFGHELFVPEISILAPIGISYYTLSIIGYVLDVYWELCEPQKNFMKHLLYTIYFPPLTSGPILKYSEMEAQLFTPHKFDHIRVLHGIQRILWGLFKKIVIADRVAIFVSAVYGDYEKYSGIYIVLAILLFALQLYTDFSGCMDIVCGASECFGINLPENFNSPFFSETVAEFWKRWHITMGDWFKDYILYPMMKSKPNRKIIEKLKKTFGKKASKDISTYLCMLILWITIGIWHGGAWKYILASGLIPGFFLIAGQATRPVTEKMINVFHIKTDVLSWRIFRMLRTFVCMCTSWVFVRAEGVCDGINMLSNVKNNFTFAPLFDGSIYQLGLTWKDFNVIYFGIFTLLVVGIAHERGVRIRSELSKQNMFAQWIVMLVALFVVLILGIYGPSYVATDFIYKNF